MESFFKRENWLESVENNLEIAPGEGDEAVCLIKSGVYDKRDEIVKRLEDSGLYIVRRSIAELSENFIREQMYPNIPAPIMEATLKHLMSGPCEIVLVKGGNVVNTLIGSVGAKTSPALCEPDTIRFIYGTHMAEELREGYKYWRNAAHRAKDEVERKCDLEKFKPFL